MYRYRLAAVICVLSAFSVAQDSTFQPLEQWRSAVLKGDAVSLKSLYSVMPSAQINTTSGKIGADSEVAFWTSLKPKTMGMTVAESGSPQPGVQVFTLQLQVVGANGHKTNVVEGQAWQNQGGVWRMVGGKRDIAKLAQPAHPEQEKIYPTGDARDQVRQAMKRAEKGQQNILLVFGADWCYDCHVLEKAFHRPDVAAVLSPNFQVVDVDIGNGDKNADLAAQYEVPLNRGVPAIAILDSKGKLLYSQKNGEWERARGLAAEDLIALLKKWKPRAK
jgi:thioredoxin 1